MNLIWIPRSYLGTSFLVLNYSHFNSMYKVLFAPSKAMEKERA